MGKAQQIARNQVNQRSQSRENQTGNEILAGGGQKAIDDFAIQIKNQQHGHKAERKDVAYKYHSDSPC